jgi:hypothetical protein
MNLQDSITLYCEGSQGGGSSKIGRKYKVVDTKYQDVISEHDTPSEAETAMLARPYSKIISRPDPSTTPAVRQKARQRLVEHNPDMNAGSDSIETVDHMMEMRSFGKDNNSVTRRMYSRNTEYEGDGTWIQVNFVNGKVGKVQCWNGSRTAKPQVANGIKGIQRFTSTYGD